MGFDEEVRGIYRKWRDSDDLEVLIGCFPPEHRMLVGLRATFIKQRMIWERKLKKRVQDDEPCGVCIAVSLECSGGQGIDCDHCPVQMACAGRGESTAQENMMHAYRAYMKEHNKFV